MITFLGRTLGWMLMTLLFFSITLVFCGAIGLSWIWEHTIGKLWQRRG